jgi:putative endopeptidase
MRRARRARTSPRARRSGAAPSSSSGAGHRLGRAARRGAARRRAEVPGLSFDAIPKLAALVGSEPLRRWKEWLAFHTLNQQANVLPKPIRDASFAFNGTALQGTPQQRPRDQPGAQRDQQRAAGRGRQGLCRQIFPGVGQGRGPEDGREHQGRLRQAGRGARLDGAVDQAGSAEEGPLDRRRRRLSRRWRDYSALQITPDNAYANQKECGLAEYRHQIAKIGKPMDRNEWWMPPQLVNAVNLPVQNALNFPAAILQRPFFDPKADAAFNYGAIGSVIGHEISHSFDNNGALFDSTGRCATGGRRPTSRASSRRATRSRRSTAPTKRCRGCGQRQADAGREYRRRRRPRRRLRRLQGPLGGKEAPVIDGFTGDQRFFIASARPGRPRCARDAAPADRMTGVHAPGQFRALTVRNLDPGMRPSTCSRGRSCTWRPSSA